MADAERPQITTKASQKKWILFLGALFFLLVTLISYAKTVNTCVAAAEVAGRLAA